MRKSDWKRAGALALATAVLATALALPASATLASATADADYIKQLLNILYSDDSESYWQGLHDLMQKYPDSPEPYYLYASDFWFVKTSYNEDKTVTIEEKEKLLQYLDTAIELALRKEHPYQSCWGERPVDPMETGEEQDYATLASELRMEILSQIPDRQEELNEAIQQYLDCKERGAQIRLKDIKKGKSQEEYQGEKEHYTELLKYDIPNDRMNLADIRQWTGTGKTSFMHEHWERDHGEGVEVRVSQNVSAFAGPRQLLAVLEDQWLTSQPIQSIQRTLNGVVAFVPTGTTVTRISGGSFSPGVTLKTEGESYFSFGEAYTEVIFVAV